MATLSRLTIQRKGANCEESAVTKEEILAKTTPPGGKPGRYKPGDKLLDFLKNL